MKVLHVHEAPLLVLHKLKALFLLLQDVRIKNELAASAVPDKTVKRILWGLAQECCQYANELSCHIQSLGVNPDEFHSYAEGHVNDGESPLPDFTHQEDIWTYCANNELKILKAYRKVLNDLDLNEGLQKMIRYQFNGLVYIFLQIKLLKN